jgi:hypothetical protein
VGNTVFDELFTALNEPKSLVPLLQVGLSVQFNWSVTQTDGPIHQGGGVPSPAMVCRRCHPADSVTVSIGQKAKGGCYITIDFDPQMSSAWLQVATVEFGVRTVLLDHEHINPETQKIV